ncbi:enoyl-CoA hydratase/isomerase family protein [Hahella sp. SMD15-11]|uniref:3-hydroxyisobutyryl-CoA hydrolase n=1 Tax=Thermohahella caldifontis TaxID=3142973 RepID=A0AB39USI8_9GAMM
MAESVAPVRVETRPVAAGGAIGVLTLNNPKALNALSLDMIRILQPRLDAWRQDQSIRAVFLQGEGERAFCAGGDIVQLYRAMTDPASKPEDGDVFFTEEYRLDYTIHRYPKPLIVWGNGIVMGGGLGLMAGASHRIVTENTTLAMPEVSIGLFPDVGATWFLNRMPDGVGLFLGLTGARCNASDARFIGLADACLPANLRDTVLEGLTRITYTDPESDRGRITQMLHSLEEAHPNQMPASELRRHLDLIRKVTGGASLSQVVAALAQLPESDPWLKHAHENFFRGCPVTAHLVWRQLHGSRDLSLPDVFRRELIMAAQCLRHPDFAEGIRARLIDKDQQPRWSFPRVEDVPESLVDEYFQPPWPEGVHPLADLK